MTWRHPPVKWKQEIENIKASYKEIYKIKGINENTAYAHAVQKDALQNSVDAIDKSNPDDWSVTIEIDNWKNPTYVSFTDTGTFGLTGRSNLSAIELDKLSFKQYIEERWSRFEALGYNNIDPRAVGARGHGKFILIAASKTKQIIYETIRKDGIHRIGHWDGKRSDPCRYPVEGENAIRYLKSILPNISALKKVGTRIIILKPVEEFTKAFVPLKESDIQKYISETWWQKISEGYTIKIIVKNLGEYVIDAPLEYKTIFEGKNHYDEIVEKVDIPIISKDIKGAKIKELVIAYSKREIPELYQGIAIQRAGMKIKSFDIRKGNEHIPNRYRKHIFGWMILNENAEEELKKYEDPNHYGIKTPPKSLARDILSSNGILSREIKEFAEEKLGLVPEEKRIKQRELAHIQTLNALNQFARSIGYALNVSIGSTSKKVSKTSKTKEIFIDMPKPDYPNKKGLKRVNYGQRVKEIKSRIVNNSNKRYEVYFEMSLKKKYGKTISGEETLNVFFEDNIIVTANKSTPFFGPYDVTFEKIFYEAGIYLIESKITDVQEKIELDSIRYLIYLERNPHATGLFKDIQYWKLKPPYDKMQYLIHRNDDELILRVNVLHPVYARAEEIEEIVHKAGQSDINPLHYDYVLQVGLTALMQEDLIGEGRLIKKFKDIDQVREDDFGIFEQTLNESLKLRQELLSIVFKST